MSAKIRNFLKSCRSYVELPSNKTCFYRNLLVPEGATESVATGKYDFEFLPAISRELDTLWGNIAIQTMGSGMDLVFTGSHTGTGTSFVAFHLAVLLARDFGVRVLYVDTSVGELHHRSIVDFGDRVGLISYFSDNIELSDLVLPTVEPRLSLIGPGRGSADARIGSLLIQPERLNQLMNEARNAFDVVIFDCAPVVLSPWSMAISKNASGVVLVCSYADSRREVCQVSLDRLAASGTNVLGAVLNNRNYPIPAKIYDWLK